MCSTARVPAETPPDQHLLVERDGGVLVVEVKHGGDTTGVGWTPAQVALYLRLVRQWVDGTPSAASILNGMLRQSAQVGLVTDRGFTVREPVELVPVIALGEPIGNPRVARERMRQVVAALAAQDVELDGLVVWLVGDAVAAVGLDEL